MAGPKLGFIGFGEAGSLLAKGLREEGLSGIRAYDICIDDPARRDLLVNRAEETGTELCATAKVLIEGSDIVISAVTCTDAKDAATNAALHLLPDQIYIDINSVSPGLKKQVGETVKGAGARFVEVAVMGAVPNFGHKVPMVLCGPAASEVIKTLEPFGMVMEDFGPEFGRAAALKMFRSIMIKGMEALLQESVLAASEYGVADKVLKSVGEGYPGIDWKALASYLIGRTAIHGERRAHEMEEVSDTLRAMGIEPMMAEAAARRIKWGGSFGLREIFNDRAPDSYHDVIREIHKQQNKS